MKEGKGGELFYPTPLSYFLPVGEEKGGEEGREVGGGGAGGDGALHGVLITALELVRAGGWFGRRGWDERQPLLPHLSTLLFFVLDVTEVPTLQVSIFDPLSSSSSFCYYLLFIIFSFFKYFFL